MGQPGPGHTTHVLFNAALLHLSITRSPCPRTLSWLTIIDYHESEEVSTMLRRAVHPGEILKDELDELGVSPTVFARAIDVPPNRIGQIVAGNRSVTGDTALRLGHWSGWTPSSG